MRRLHKLGLLVGACAAALGLAACSDAGRVRVYVEPTYEQDKLQLLLSRSPEVRVVSEEGAADVNLRVEAVPNQRLKATIRAREPRSQYEAYAVAEFLRVRNSHGGRARWVSSFTDGVREDDVDAILLEVVREAARQEHRGQEKPPAEVERALHAASPDS